MCGPVIDLGGSGQRVGEHAGDRTAGGLIDER